MHTLTFKKPYKSIGSLDPVELPEFVVLTGKNGSGKTHLLEAVSNGSVSSGLIQNTHEDVILYNWNSIIPKDTGVFHVHQHLNQRSNWFTQIRAQQDLRFPEIRQQLTALGVPHEACSTIYKVRHLSKRQIELHFAPEEVDGIYEKIKGIRQANGQYVYNQTRKKIGDDIFKKVAPEVVKEKPELFLETSESQFFRDRRFLWGEVDPFQQAFGRLFSTYRDLIHQNDRLEKYPPNDSELVHLPQKQFIAEHGEPPWDFVNRILEVCELDFRVNSPPLHETASFETRLTKVSSDVEMRFGDLSSGEKVLMSFALCLYNASDRRQKKKFPKLLLLDEVDAPLHPSMVVSLLNTIRSVLVDDEGISVVLTTHSPSTVALANEEALYEMDPIGPRIEKCSKGKALSILTTGVPTLSISFEGRRQVFVESRTDAGIYESLYQAFKGQIGSERSLSFIEVGHRPESGGEANAGCTQVQRIVSALVAAGNESVFGLVDWDGGVAESQRVKVLSPSIRNGLESAILDPVLLVATCVRSNIRYMRDKDVLSDSESYVDLRSWETSRWQRAVDILQTLVLGPDLADQEGLRIDYLGGMHVCVNRDYLHLDDHALEERIVEKFGFLKPHNNHAGGLMRHIIETTLADMPELLPLDVILTYRGLLDD